MLLLILGCSSNGNINSKGTIVVKVSREKYEKYKDRSSNSRLRNIGKLLGIGSGLLGLIWIGDQLSSDYQHSPVLNYEDNNLISQTIGQGFEVDGGLDRKRRSNEIIASLSEEVFFENINTDSIVLGGKLSYSYFNENNPSNPLAMKTILSPVGVNFKNARSVAVDKEALVGKVDVRGRYSNIQPLAKGGFVYAKCYDEASGPNSNEGGCKIEYGVVSKSGGVTNSNKIDCEGCNSLSLACSAHEEEDCIVLTEGSQKRFFMSRINFGNNIPQVLMKEVIGVKNSLYCKHSNQFYNDLIILGCLNLENNFKHYSLLDTNEVKIVGERMVIDGKTPFDIFDFGYGKSVISSEGKPNFVEYSRLEGLYPQTFDVNINFGDSDFDEDNKKVILGESIESMENVEIWANEEQSIGKTSIKSYQGDVIQKIQTFKSILKREVDYDQSYIFYQFYLGWGESFYKKLRSFLKSSTSDQSYINLESIDIEELQKMLKSSYFKISRHFEEKVEYSEIVAFGGNVYITGHKGIAKEILISNFQIIAKKDIDVEADSIKFETSTFKNHTYEIEWGYIYNGYNNLGDLQSLITLLNSEGNIRLGKNIVGDNFISEAGKDIEMGSIKLSPMMKESVRHGVWVEANGEVPALLGRIVGVKDTYGALVDGREGEGMIVEGSKSKTNMVTKDGMGILHSGQKLQKSKKIGKLSVDLGGTVKRIEGTEKVAEEIPGRIRCDRLILKGSEGDLGSVNISANEVNAENCKVKVRAPKQIKTESMTIKSSSLMNDSEVGKGGASLEFGKSSLELKVDICSKNKVTTKEQPITVEIDKLNSKQQMELEGVDGYVRSGKSKNRHRKVTIAVDDWNLSSGLSWDLKFALEAPTFSPTLGFGYEKGEAVLKLGDVKWMGDGDIEDIEEYNNIKGMSVNVSLRALYNSGKNLVTGNFKEVLGDLYTEKKFDLNKALEGVTETVNSTSVSYGGYGATVDPPALKWAGKKCSQLKSINYRKKSADKSSDDHTNSRGRRDKGKEKAEEEESSTFDHGRRGGEENYDTEREEYYAARRAHFDKCLRRYILGDNHGGNFDFDIRDRQRASDGMILVDRAIHSERLDVFAKLNEDKIKSLILKPSPSYIYEDYYQSLYNYLDIKPIGFDSNTKKLIFIFPNGSKYIARFNELSSDGSSEDEESSTFSLISAADDLIRSGIDGCIGLKNYAVSTRERVYDYFNLSIGTRSIINNGTYYSAQLALISSSAHFLTVGKAAAICIVMVPRALGLTERARNTAEKKLKDIGFEKSGYFLSHVLVLAVEAKASNKLGGFLEKTSWGGDKVIDWVRFKIYPKRLELNAKFERYNSLTEKVDNASIKLTSREFRPNLMEITDQELRITSSEPGELFRTQKFANDMEIVKESGVLRIFGGNKQLREIPLSKLSVSPASLREVSKVEVGSLLSSESVKASTQLLTAENISMGAAESGALAPMVANFGSMIGEESIETLVSSAHILNFAYLDSTMRNLGQAESEILKNMDNVVQYNYRGGTEEEAMLDVAREERRYSSVGNVVSAEWKGKGRLEDPGVEEGQATSTEAGNVGSVTFPIGNIYGPGNMDNVLYFRKDNGDICAYSYEESRGSSSSMVSGDMLDLLAINAQEEGWLKDRGRELGADKTLSTKSKGFVDKTSVVKNKGGKFAKTRSEVGITFLDEEIKTKDPVVREGSKGQIKTLKDESLNISKNIKNVNLTEHKHLRGEKNVKKKVDFTKLKVKLIDNKSVGTEGYIAEEVRVRIKIKKDSRLHKGRGVSSDNEYQIEEKIVCRIFLDKFNKFGYFKIGNQKNGIKIKRWYMVNRKGKRINDFWIEEDRNYPYGDGGSLWKLHRGNEKGYPTKTRVATLEKNGVIQRR